MKKSVQPPPSQRPICRRGRLRSLGGIQRHQLPQTEIGHAVGSIPVGVAWCALAACMDRRDEDYRFGFDLFKRLLGNPKADATFRASSSS